MKYRGFELTVVDTWFAFQEITAPATPPSDQVRIYAKDKSGVSALYAQDDAGTEHELTNRVGGSGTANRVTYWSGTNTIAANAALTQNQIVFPDANGLPTGDSKLYWDNTNKRIGIGTSSPSTPLHVQAEGAAESVTFDYYGGSTNIRTRRASGTSASPTAVVANDPLGRLSGIGYHSGGAFGAAVARVEMSAAENFTAANQGTFLSFYTTPTGSTTLAERFRIGPAGQLGIGGATYGTATNVLKSGGASAAPSWGTVAASEVTSGANVTAASTKITLAGTPTGAALTAFSIDVNQANLDHGSIGGLTDDDHTGYLRLAGRTGTTNDPVLSSDSSGTIYGSSASGQWLTLTSTSHATKGLLVFGGSQYMDQANSNFVFAPSISNATANFVYYSISPTYTGSGSGFQGAKFAATMAPSASIAVAYGFLGQTTFSPGSGVTITTGVSSFAQCAYGNVVGAVTSGITSYVVAPSFSGSLKPSNQYGVYVENQGSASISKAVGLYLTKQSGATTNADLLFDKTSGAGIKVDIAAPTYPWHDIIGSIVAKTTGAGTPTFTTYRGSIQAYQFAVNDAVYMVFHLPHDYAPGTDLYIHTHWSHIGTLVTGGTVTWQFISTYAKGHNQAAFPAEVTTTVSPTASTTQYQHMVSEAQLSTSGGSASLLDTDNLEPDGLILMKITLTANAITVSGGGAPDPFLHTADIHYQSTGIGTKAKAPNFYT